MKQLFIISLLIAMLLPLTTSCGKDEVGEKSEQGGNQGGSMAPIIVTVDANGKANGGHQFVKIDDTNFYIDDIKYTVSEGNLIVTGYNETYFKGNAKIISQLNYDGHEMHVIGIGKGAFADCTSLTSVTIPSSVTSIGDYAFYYCSGLTSVHITDLAAWCKVSFVDNPLIYAHHLFLNGKEIKDLVIPSSVTSINSGVFSGCTGLTSVAIPSSVTSIGGSAFYACTNLTSVTINSNSVVSKNYSDSSSLRTIFGEQVKSYILGDGVTSIGEGAFYGCRGLSSVTIPSSVTSIGSGAFSGCSGLTSVTIPSSVTSIGSGAFAYCRGLTSVTIPSSVTSIGRGTFYECTGLTSVTIPSSVTSIGSAAFLGCIGLTSVAIPSSVTSIGDQAFYACTGLTSVTIPSSVTSIGEAAFEDCTGLTSATILSSVDRIEKGVFRGCTGLTSVTIPSSVTAIMYEAFRGCKCLAHVYLYAEITPIDAEGNAFVDSNIANATLHVPASAIEVYRNIRPWSLFGTIVAI